MSGRRRRLLRVHQFRRPEAETEGLLAVPSRQRRAVCDRGDRARQPGGGRGIHPAHRSPRARHRALPQSANRLARARTVAELARRIGKLEGGAASCTRGWAFRRGRSRLKDKRMDTDVILKRFEQPDEVREFELGRFELVTLGGMTIGRATYQPGWKWSAHVGATLGQTSCNVEHVGMVVSGRATAAMDDGEVIEMRAGDIFYIPPGHDSWVVGNEPYVSLHFMGAEEYASHD